MLKTFQKFITESVALPTPGTDAVGDALITYRKTINADTTLLMLSLNGYAVKWFAEGVPSLAAGMTLKGFRGRVVKHDEYKGRTSVVVKNVTWQTTSGRAYNDRMHR